MNGRIKWTEVDTDATLQKYDNETGDLKKAFDDFTAATSKKSLEASHSAALMFAQQIENRMHSTDFC